MTTSTTPSEHAADPVSASRDDTAASQPGPGDARRFAWATAAGGGLALLVMAWFATRGFATLLDHAALGGFFDAQGRALLHGHWDVPPDAATFERFVIDGRYYMYFGPTPAILRMPLLLVTDSFDGRLSRVSMILASALLIVAIARLTWLARRSVRGGCPVSRGEAVLAGVIVFVASLGTPALYITSWTAVYHEAIQWGLALALVSYGALLAWMLDSRTRDLVVAGVTAILALLARGSVGLGPVAALGVVLLVRGVRAWQARREGRPVDWRPLWGLGGACAAAAVLYAYVNQVKFGSPFATPPWEKQDLLVNWPPRVAAMEANGGKLTGFHYAPTTLYHFLRPDGIAFDRLFPWILPLVPRRVIGDAVFENFRPTASLTATAPLMLVASAVGLWAAVARRALRRWLTPLAGAAVGAVGVLGFAWLDHRYEADFVPLLLLPGLLGTWVVLDWLAGRSRAVVVTVAVVAVLVAAWGVWANFGLAYVYQRAQPDWSTVDDRASLVETQLRVADALGTPLSAIVRTGDTLPADGTTGELFVSGDCAGVYRFDGAQWLPVEQTADTGYFPLRVRLDRDAEGRQPVLSAADDEATTVVWARNEAGGRIGFEYEWRAADPDNEFSTRVPLGSVARSDDGSVAVSVRVDAREGITDFLQVRAAGDLLLDRDVNKLRGPIVLGRQSTVDGATRVAGDVDLRPAATPLCDRLVDLGVRLP